MNQKEKAFDSWSFTERDLDQDQWYVHLTGGKYHGVVYNYTNISLNDETESINFDYNVVDYLDDDPYGEPDFNEATGQILLSILEDSFKDGDYVIGDKNESGSTDNPN